MKKIFSKEPSNMVVGVVMGFIFGCFASLSVFLFSGVASNSFGSMDLLISRVGIIIASILSLGVCINAMVKENRNNKIIVYEK